MGLKKFEFIVWPKQGAPARPIIEATSFGEAIRIAKTVPVDVIFLDINMDGMNGFEVAKELRMIRELTQIVFVSAYESFVYDSFEFYPAAFLRKDRIYEELPRIIRRVADKLDETVQINVRTSEGDMRIKTKEIVFINSVGNYCYIRLSDGKQYTARSTLTSFEESLAEYDFFRVHSAYIVTLNHIQRIDKTISVLMGPEKIAVPVSQRRWAGFKKAYSEFINRRFL